ncbi:hypothetical protein D3242_08035 [Mesorhizobium jarvisii]|uniref:Uncharacterized protein n=1 Tax=Mesorhizobium jarvisii TaxID=1777867 RepID=A0AA92XHG9_9HYPH|nr:hypothetical protein D3242_08035 [Mesorhizobium jarvisii]
MFGAIPEGKRYTLFPGKPFHTFPGVALRLRIRSDWTIEFGKGGPTAALFFCAGVCCYQRQTEGLHKE